MEKLNLEKITLRKFGFLMGIAFMTISFVAFLRHKNIYIGLGFISTIFFVLAFARPEFLKHIYMIWMKFAFVLGYINTRLLLVVIFYLVFTPVGVLFKLFGKDMLDEKIEHDKESYWTSKDKNQFSLKSYEKQF